MKGFFLIFKGGVYVDNYSLYFNLAFFSVLALGMLFGYLRGMKKSLFSFIRTLTFYLIFFLTLDLVVNYIWTGNFPFLGGLLGNVMPELSGITKLSAALPILIAKFLGSEYESIYTNPDLLAFLNGLSLFVVKLVWMILYFTIINLIYRLIFFIVRIIFFRKDKHTDKYKSKNRGFGAVFGLMQASLGLFVTLIVFGGLIDITANISQVIPAESQQVSQLSLDFPRENALDPRQPLSFDFGSVLDPGSMGIDEALDTLNSLVTGYNENIIVKYASKVTAPGVSNGDATPLNLYLFDRVLSVPIPDESPGAAEGAKINIAFREEIKYYSGAVKEFMNSDFASSGDLADISTTNITNAFDELAKSNLITSLIPLALEVGKDYINENETLGTVQIELTHDDIYGIDWKTELSRLGAIAATGLTIVNSSGLLDGNTNIEEVEINGNDVAKLFNELGKSQVVNLGLSKAISPIMEALGPTVQSIVTVPDNIVWQDELEAFGAIAAEVLNTGLTISDVESGDVNEILATVSEVDFNVLLESKIVTNGLINILSGEAEISLGADISNYLVIPPNTVWLDYEDDQGNPVSGELRNILTAINSLVKSASDIDLTNPTLADIANIDIDDVFNSRVLTASISKQITDLDLGDTINLVIPDSVYDADGYIKQEEIQNIFNAVKMAASELACTPGDAGCSDLGFNMNNVFTLSGDNIDTLLDSQILYATVGNLLVDLGSDALTIPNGVLTQVVVDDQNIDIVNDTEIKNVFLAVTALGITDIENLEVSGEILQNLSIEGTTTLDPDKADKLFGSDIIDATISKYILDFATGDNAVITVPYVDAADNPVLIEDSEDGVTYISDDELTNILQGILSLDITDFNSFDTIDLSTIFDNASTLLDSAILHATISKQLLDIGSDTLVIPNSVITTVDNNGEDFDYVDADEITNVLDALNVLNILDFSTDFAVDASLLQNLGETDDPTALDQDKADILFTSKILTATISKYILDFASGDSAFVVVPYEDVEGHTVLTDDVTDGISYISDDELANVLQAILSLDITDFNDFDSLGLDTIINNSSTLLDSAILHATISKQILDIGSDVLIVPNSVVTTVVVNTQTTDFVDKDEISSVLDALTALNIFSFDTSFSVDATLLQNLAVDGDPTTLDQAKADKLFASKIISATLSDYILDYASGDSAFLIVPYKDVDDNTIVTDDLTDGISYISDLELTHILAAILKLDVTDFTDFDTLNLDTIINNSTTLLDSAMLHATISKQLLDLSGTLIIPDDVVTTVTANSQDTDFVDKDEINSVLDALGVLNINSFDDAISFDAGIFDNLENNDQTALDSAKLTTLLNSEIVHATVSDMILDLDESNGGALTVPVSDEGGTAVVTTVGSVDFVSKPEINSVLQALYKIGIDNFDTIDLENTALLLDNSSTLLASAIIQATVSKQILDTTAITVPIQDSIGNDVVVTQGATKFIKVAEIDALLAALDQLDIGNPTTFDNSLFDMTKMDSEPEQDTLLASAIIHASMSKTLMDVDPSVLTVPERAEDNSFIQLTTGPTGEETTFVAKPEIKAMLNAFNVMGFTDLTSFNTSFTTSQLLDNSTTVLLSSSLQATMSNQIINSSAGNLVVPDKDQSNADIRILRGSVTYIRKTELEALVTSLNMLTGVDIDGFDIVPDDIFAFDDTELDTFLGSNIMQATVSDKVFIGSSNEITPVSGTLIIPTYFREGIKVDGADSEQIEKEELKHLIHAMDVMDVGTFDGSVSSSKVSTLEAEDIDTLLGSGSMHTTIDYMLQNNGNINSSIPDAAITDLDYKDGIITVAETKAFILAAKVLGGDISSFDIAIGDLTGLTTIQKETILTSMIARCKLTPDLVSAAPLAGVTITAADYEGWTPDALIYTTALAIVS